MVYKGRHLCRRYPFVSVQLTMAAKWISVALLVCCLQGAALAGDATSDSRRTADMVFKELTAGQAIVPCLVDQSKELALEVAWIAQSVVFMPLKVMTESYPKNLVPIAKEMWTDMAKKCDSSLTTSQCTKQKLVEVVKHLIAMVNDIIMSVVEIIVRSVELEILAIASGLQRILWLLPEFVACLLGTY